jgi:hypothetical protein
MSIPNSTTDDEGKLMHAKLNVSVMKTQSIEGTGSTTMHYRTFHPLNIRCRCDNDAREGCILTGKVRNMILKSYGIKMSSCQMRHDMFRVFNVNV